jgi:soluble lytic murein transglycosylase-like protein
MQLMPAIAKRFNVDDIWDPEDNLHGGMAYLRWLLRYYKGDVVLTLAAYNAGEGAVDRYSGVPPYQETRQYVKRIAREYPLATHPVPQAVQISLAE